MVNSHEPPSVHQRRVFARAGLWAVIGGAAALVVALALILLHRPHTTQLTPGQAQPSALAFVDLGSA
jgi:hypothetical protein